MESLLKWIDRIYTETDFGRSIATSVTGLIGLVVYLTNEDWVITLIIMIIVFPLIRITSAFCHEKLSKKTNQSLREKKSEEIFNKLTPLEREIVIAFAESQSFVMTWGDFNKLPLSSYGIESLMQRGLLHTSMTADGIRETFVLDPEIFNAALKNIEKNGD